MAVSHPLVDLEHGRGLKCGTVQVDQAVGVVKSDDEANSPESRQHDGRERGEGAGVRGRMRWHLGGNVNDIHRQLSVLPEGKV